MATIVNNPPSQTGDSSGSGFLLGIVLLAVVLFLFLYFGLPLIRGGIGTPQVNIPDKINVNVQGGK